jgi:K+-transporting ATPase c subunit
MKKLMATVSALFLMLILSGLAFSQGVVTGLIIDAQNLSFTPSAAPKIMDEEGREVYGSAYVDKEWLEKQGIVGYAKSLSEAKANSRVSGNPFVVKAIRVAGANNRDLILSYEDARKIRELSQNLNFLDQAKVIIIVP